MSSHREAIEAVLSGRSARDLESDVLDFKTIGRSREDTLVNLSEAAACFANSRGGHLVVGVSDAGAGPTAFVGSDLDEARTQRRIYELTEPGLIVTVANEQFADTVLTVISIPRSPDVHQVKGRATERVGASCVPMSAQRITTVLTDRRGDDWSATDSTLAPDAIRSRAQEELRALLHDAPDPERRRWADLSIEELLRRLGLTTAAGTLNHAGEVLLVGRDGADVHYTHRRTRSGPLSLNESLAGPMLVAVGRVLELIENRTSRTPVHLPNGQQLFVADLPDLAVREALVNAVMHRDYQVSGPVQVEQSDTRLAVTSPGDFVLGVTPDNILTTSSRARNPALAAAIRSLGLAETAGVGVDRMYAEMTSVGHHPPVFTSDGVRVSVALSGGAPNAPLTRFVASMPPERREDPDTLLILVSLLRNRTVTADRLGTLLQKGSDEIETILRRLSTDEVGLLERTRASATHRFGVYRLRGPVIAALGAAVTYHRRTGDDADRKIIDVVRETGQVNGRLVRSLLDLDAAAASRVLSQLVEQDILVKTSNAQRGPSVTYGPGSAFPYKKRR